MKRQAIYEISSWLEQDQRKPLVIRGARQVGKTWLVRHIAEISGKQLIELNFERHPEYKSFFQSNDPQQILFTISASLEIDIDIHQAILFLDEIQVFPELLSKLRWFAEELQDLPVIATGSLLEFVLEEHSFSMPVGRINYFHLEPLSFLEFLLAKDKVKLIKFLKTSSIVDIPAAIHTQCLQLVKEYMLIGGMPAAVAKWCATKSLTQTNQIQHDIITTYRDDFTKYAKHSQLAELDLVLNSSAMQLSQKFTFTNVDQSLPAAKLHAALKLLNKARVCHKVACSKANGIPFAAEEKAKFFKVIMLDIGLCCAILKLKYTDLMQPEDINLVNRAGISEQLVGQILRTLEPYYIEPSLYYWARKKTAAAEIDYLYQFGTKIIPIEVKSGTTGSLKSLHYFMHSKRLDFAVRINSAPPSICQVQVKLTTGEPVQYRLLSLPFYMLEQLPRLLEQSAILGEN